MAVMNFGKAKIKDHVTPLTPGLKQTMRDLFDIDIDKLFNEACRGNPDAVKAMGDMIRLAKQYEENLPNAKDAALTAMRVTGEYNKAMSEMIKQARVSGTQVLNAAYSATNDETRMRNQIVEMRDKQTNEVTAEAGRHVRARNLIAVEGNTAELMAIAEYQTSLLRTEDKIPLAQQRADEAYRSAVNKAYWARGSEADIGRIRKPNYEGNRYGMGGIVSGFWNGFKRTMGL